MAPTETISLELFTHLARTSLLLGNLQERCLEPFGLRFIDYSVLRIVRLRAPERLSPTRLADEVVCTTGGMTKMLDRLETAGLVARQPDPLDRRGRLVVLTRRGERLIDRASDAYRDERERLLGHLDAGEATDIDAALRRLLEVLEEDRQGALRQGAARDGGPATGQRG